MQGQNTRHLEANVESVVQRCFEDCVTFNMTPEQCKARIEHETLNFGIEDLQVNIVPVNLKASLGPPPGAVGTNIIKIPTNLHGYVACDQHNAIIKYTDQWRPKNDPQAEISVAAQCNGMLAGDCCKHLQMLVGKDLNGNCMDCVAKQEPLTPVPFTDGTSGFKDYSLDPITGSCEEIIYTTPQVQKIDQFARTKLQIDENYSQHLRNQGYISCHDLRALEDRLMVHARSVPTAQRYIGTITCTYCDESMNFIGDFEQLLGMLADAFFYIESVNVDNAVAKVLIYTEEGSDQMPAIKGTPADDATDLLLLSPPILEGDVVGDGPLLSPTAKNTEVMNTGTTTSTTDVKIPVIGIPTIPVTDIPTIPLIDTPTIHVMDTPTIPAVPTSGNDFNTLAGDVTDTKTVECGIDEASSEGFPVVDSGLVRQSCRSNLPSDLRITTSQIVSMVNGSPEYINDLSGKCKTRFIYKVCNWVSSVGKRNLGRSHELSGKQRNLGGAHEPNDIQRNSARSHELNGMQRNSRRSHELIGMHSMPQQVVERLDREQLRNLRKFGKFGSDFHATFSASAKGSRSAKATSTTSTASTTTITSSINSGHVILGWVGQCKVTNYGVSDGRGGFVSDPLKMFAQVADPDTCFVGVQVVGSQIPAKQCTEVMIEYSGRVAVTSEVERSGISFYGHYKPLEQFPTPDCRNTPKMTYSTKDKIVVEGSMLGFKEDLTGSQAQPDVPGGSFLGLERDVIGSQANLDVSGIKQPTSGYSNEEIMTSNGPTTETSTTKSKKTKTTFKHVSFPGRGGALYRGN